MREEKELKPDRDELAGGVRKLRPAGPEAAAAREVWFEAGYRAGRRSMNVWRATAALLVIGMTGVAVWEHGSRAPMAPQTPLAVEQRWTVGQSSDEKIATGD